MVPGSQLPKPLGSPEQKSNGESSVWSLVLSFWKHFRAMKLKWVSDYP